MENALINQRECTRVGVVRSLAAAVALLPVLRAALLLRPLAIGRAACSTNFNLIHFPFRCNSIVWPFFGSHFRPIFRHLQQYKMAQKAVWNVQK